MGKCATCGNGYDKSFDIVKDGHPPAHFARRLVHTKRRVAIHTATKAS